MSELSQANTALRLTTPLGPDALIALGLQGEERLSTPFEYTLETAVAADGLDLAGLPGQSVDVTLVDGTGTETILNAIVWAVRHEGRHCQLTLRPWLARLGLTSDNRIFQDQNVLDIVASILGENELGPLRRAVTAAPAPRPYCVQFGETDLAFVSRLLEEEGLGYYFAHAAGQHALPFLALPDSASFGEDRRIQRLSTSSGLAPGRVEARDYAFEAPDESLEVTIGSVSRGLYLYPGRHATTAAGETAARRQLEAHVAAARAVEGETPWRPLTAGQTVSLKNAPDGALNELYVEDKAGEEEVYLHAQKDLTLEVGNDETATIKHSRTVTIEEGDDSLTVTKGKRSVKVEAGDESHAVGGKRSLTVTGDETRKNGAKYTHHVSGDATLTIDGALTIKVAGDVTIQAGGAMNLKSGGAFSIKAGSSLSLSAGTSATIKAGTSAELSGGTTATVKGGASAELDGGGMLTLKGGLVQIN